MSDAGGTYYVVAHMPRALSVAALLVAMLIARRLAGWRGLLVGLVAGLAIEAFALALVLAVFGEMR